MLVPKRVKYRKQQRGNQKGMAYRGIEIVFGEYGLLSEERGLITSRQIEAARRAITHCTQRGGRLWIRIFPHMSVTKKPPETRMGGGKGDVYEFVARVWPGTVMFEIGGVTKDIGIAALKLAGNKLSVKSRIAQKGE